MTAWTVAADYLEALDETIALAVVDGWLQFRDNVNSVAIVELRVSAANGRPVVEGCF